MAAATPGGGSGSGDVMLAPDAVIAATKRLLAELQAFRETIDRLHREPRPGPTDYGNLNADAEVAQAAATFSTDAAARSRSALDEITGALQNAIEYAAAIHNNDQAHAAWLAAIARESRGG